MIYLSLDGDDVGHMIEKQLMENNEKEIAKISKIIQTNTFAIASALQKLNFQIIYNAGDNILAKGKEVNISDLKSMFFELELSCTYSVGIADKLNKAYIALKYAKSIGKNVIVLYNEKDEFEVYAI